jgi:hypothetical protein
VKYRRMNGIVAGKQLSSYWLASADAAASGRFHEELDREVLAGSEAFAACTKISLSSV